MELSKELERVVLPGEKVITIPPDATLEEALKVLIDKKFSAVPVVNSSGSYVGTIGKTEILSLVTHDLTVHYHHLKDRNVYEAITDRIPSLPINSSFTDVSKMMITHPFIALVEEDSKFYGIATRELVLKQVMNITE